MTQDAPDILKKIVATKKVEVADSISSLTEWKKKAAAAPLALDFPAALSRNGLSVIAEVKKASPSAGIISTDFNPVGMAKAYQNGGADAISVLTDKQYFKGDSSYLSQIRSEVSIPLLRKDFIIHDVQIYEARALGADTFLLIAAILSVVELRDFLQLGRELGMEPLVEAHDEVELAKAVEAGAKVIGINNRDLRTFTVDLAISEKLASMMPPEAITVSESGIFNENDVRRLKKADFSAILVGQSLMEAGIEHCGEKISSFKAC